MRETNLKQNKLISFSGNLKNESFPGRWKSILSALTLFGARLSSADADELHLANNAGQVPVPLSVNFTPSLHYKDVSFTNSFETPIKATQVEINRRVALRHIINELCAMSQYKDDGSPRPLVQDGYPRHHVPRAPLPLRLSAEQSLLLSGKAKGMEFAAPPQFAHITNGVMNRYWLLDVYGKFLSTYSRKFIPQSRHEQITMAPLDGAPAYGCQLPGVATTEKNDADLQRIASKQTEILRMIFLKEVGVEIGKNVQQHQELVPIPYGALNDALSKTEMKLDYLRRSGLNALFNKMPDAEELFEVTYDRINQAFAQGPLQPSIFYGSSPSTHLDEQN